MTSDVLNAVAQISAECILDSLVIGVALAAIVWVLLRVVSRQNSATRFAVWFAALIGTALIPLFDLAVQQSSVSGLSPVPHALISLPLSWALYLSAIWAVIAALALVRVAVGFVELRRLRRSCRPVQLPGTSWQETVARFCPARKLEVMTSDRIHVPTAIGFFRPAVLIPARLLQELSAAELNQVLLHELAHLRRWDDWTNVVQKLLKALLFFHPAVWWIEEHISLERELACDDAVLAATASPRAYAQCLALLAEKSVVGRSAALAQAAVHRIRQTTLRVARILDVNRRNSASAGKSALALAASVACAFVVVAWHAPRLVAFQGAPPIIAKAVVANAQRLGAPDSNPVQANPGLKPGAARPAGIQSKASLEPGRQSARRMQPASTQIADRNFARVIQAKAAQQPMFTTGVLIIFVDDPLLGPTPVLWRFAVWQVTPPQRAPQAQAATPQKST